MEIDHAIKKEFLKRVFYLDTIMEKNLKAVDIPCGAYENHRHFAAHDMLREGLITHEQREQLLNFRVMLEEVLDQGDKSS